MGTAAHKQAHLSDCLPAPAGEGLFVGNSMPIRDLDMYACPPRAATAAAHDAGQQQQQRRQQQQGVVPAGLGAPVAANRGASGIDGVLSTGEQSA